MADGIVVRYRVSVNLSDGSTISFPDNKADPFYEFYVGPVTTLWCADFEQGASDWTHGATPSSFGDFYLETLGSLRDLRAWGYNPHVFIQPGSWNIGPCTFDNPAKLQTQYAGLVRRVYVAMEAYYPKTRTVAIPSPGRVGPAAYPIVGLAPATIDSIVRAAISSRGWVEFMWHSREMSPSSLTPRLAVIAALRDSGLVTVMPFYRALHATH